MYKFYKDKNENFECNIGLEGASLLNAQARLILENDEFNLIFDGQIDKNGKCIVPIKKLKILTEGLTGKLKLEVIVEEDTYFLPFQDEFIIDINKKLTLEVIEQKDFKKKIIVEVKQNDILKIVDEMYFKLKSNNINLQNIKSNSKIINSIIGETINKYNIQTKELQIIQEQLLEKLIKTK